MSEFGKNPPHTHTHTHTHARTHAHTHTHTQYLHTSTLTKLAISHGARVGKKSRWRMTTFEQSSRHEGHAWLNHCRHLQTHHGVLGPKTALLVCRLGSEKDGGHENTINQRSSRPVVWLACIGNRFTLEPAVGWHNRLAHVSSFQEGFLFQSRAERKTQVAVKTLKIVLLVSSGCSVNIFLQKQSDFCLNLNS